MIEAVDRNTEAAGGEDQANGRLQELDGRERQNVQQNWVKGQRSTFKRQSLSNCKKITLPQELRDFIQHKYYEISNSGGWEYVLFISFTMF